MSATKHTQGPWEVFHDVDLWPQVVGCGKIIANVNPESFNVGVADLVEMPSDANARLIAAAPELLEVAEGILADDMLQHLPAEYIAKVRAAIAKATGGQP